MNKTYNIYCDESCHLENDGQKAMVIGAVWCEKEEKVNLFTKIKELKKKHKLDSHFEIKWNKVSESKFQFYADVVNLFFDSEELFFRAIVVADKSELNHEAFNHTHDDFYYKMYFDMLKVIITPHDQYNVYLDIKDTQGYEKVKKLREVISNAYYDFSRQIVKNIQEVRSDEVSLLQVADLLIGALSYYSRSLETSTAKMKLIELIKARSGYGLKCSTLPLEKKFNYFIWHTGYRRGSNGGF